MRAYDAFAALGFDLNLGVPSRSELAEAWRRARGEAHPDKGGDAATFDRLRRAYHVARAYQDEDVRCPECEGAGKLRRTRGFATVWLRCVPCKGRGWTKRLPDEENGI